jgi:hypothetical protein
MHRSESEEIVDCVDCGTPLDVDRERGYRGSGDWALCQACALERGGRFDEEEDRWTVAPNTLDLPVEESEHRVR